MKVGLLESKLDPFINDLRERLAGLPVEFVAFSSALAPLKSDYRVLVDRLSFRQPFLQEMLKNLSLDGTYVINNPFSAIATNKLVELKLCNSLGIPFPRTVVLPDVTAQEDLGEILDDLDWQWVSQAIGFPCVIKPYDGSGWEQVYPANSIEELKAAHELVKHRRVILIQEMVRYQGYYRAFCIGQKEVLFIKWIPRPQAMGEYLLSDLKPIEAIRDRLAHQTIRLNMSLDLDVNAVEWCIDQEGKAWLIEAFNEVPDIDKRSIPPPYYEWIVEKFAELVSRKFASAERNKTILGIRGD